MLGYDLKDWYDRQTRKFLKEQAQTNTVPLWSTPELHSWLHSNNIHWNKGVPPYADGGIGRAYFLENKVVKFTSDPVEYHIASLVKRNPESPSRILDTIKIKDRLCILSDKLPIASQPYQLAADALMAQLDSINETKKPLPIKTWCGEASKISGLGKDFYPFMEHVAKQVWKLYNVTEGYLHTDASYSNVGFFNNEVHFIDLGPNVTKYHNPKEIIQKLKKIK
jgi:hypothetical protein